MDLDNLLDQTATVADDPGAVTRARAQLDAATHRSAKVVHLKRRKRYAVGIAGAAAAAVLVPVIGINGKPTANADAAEVMRMAAQSAGAQGGDWQSAAYWHSVSRYTRAGQAPVTREIWIAHHGNGALKDPGVDSGVIGLDGPSFAAGGGSEDWDELWQLPTNPKQLEKQLRDGINGAGNGDDSELFVIVGDLLRESPAPPALRKALWEVAATIPGVELQGRTTDLVGRSGYVLHRDDQSYVVDTDTGKLLQETEPGWVSTYLEQGPVDSEPAVTNDGPKGKQG